MTVGCIEGLGKDWGLSVGVEFVRLLIKDDLCVALFRWNKDLSVSADLGETMVLQLGVDTGSSLEGSHVVRLDQELLGAHVSCSRDGDASKDEVASVHLCSGRYLDKSLVSLIKFHGFDPEYITLIGQNPL